MTKIAIIGASGFVGKNLVKRLAPYFKLTCFIRQQTKAEDILFLKTNSVILENNLTKSLQQFDIIFNVAGQLGSFAKEKKSYWKNNVELVENIISLAQNSKIIHVSSAGVYGTGLEINESNSATPLSLYEQSKIAADNLVQQHSNYLIFRPALLYGPYDLNLLPLFKFIKKYPFIIIGNGNNIIAPTFIDHFITILYQSIFTHVSNEIFLVAGPNIAIRDFQKLIATNFYTKIPMLPTPLFLLKKLANLNEFISRTFSFPPFITHSRINMMTQDRSYNTDKLKRIFKYPHSPLLDGVSTTVKYYRQNGLL